MMPAGVTWPAPGRCRNMTGATVLAAVVYGLLLGVKHALDADHIVAVTAIVSRSRRLLGVAVARRLVKDRAHAHRHRHDGTSHLHSHSHHDGTGHGHLHVRRPLLIGMAHGLAGS